MPSTPKRGLSSSSSSSSSPRQHTVYYPDLFTYRGAKVPDGVMMLIMGEVDAEAFLEQKIEAIRLMQLDTEERAVVVLVLVLVLLAPVSNCISQADGFDILLKEILGVYLSHDEHHDAVRRLLAAVREEVRVVHRVLPGPITGRPWSPGKRSPMTFRELISSQRLLATLYVSTPWPYTSFWDSK